MNPNELADMAKALQALSNQMAGSPQPLADAHDLPAMASPPADSINEDLTENDEFASAKICYEHTANKFHKLMPGGRWVALTKSCVENHLIAAGCSPCVQKGDLMSEVAFNIVEIQSRHYVDFVGNVAGYSKGLLKQGNTRILVPDEAKFIYPVPGNWDMLRGILEKMFGAIQLPYVYGWLKISLEMFAAKSWMAGQVMALGGEPQSGKNLFASLVRHLFGGRSPGKPYDYMTQKTDFNSDVIGAELLTIEDEASQTGINARRAFGAKIKDMAVNDTRRVHRKHAEALTMVPLQRLIISLNNQPERLLVLPPMDSDVEDKIMLLKVEKHAMPMRTRTPTEVKQFMATLLAQMPAFAAFLQSWSIPGGLEHDRFGIRHYHNPELLETLQGMSPEQRLLELIDEVIFGDVFRDNWAGKSTALDRELKNSPEAHHRREVTGLLPAANSCGHYLARLAVKRPDRVTKLPGSGGSQNWTIWREKPEKEVSPEIMEKVLAMRARAKEQKRLSGEQQEAAMVS